MPSTLARQDTHNQPREQRGVTPVYPLVGSGLQGSSPSSRPKPIPALTPGDGRFYDAESRHGRRDKRRLLQRRRRARARHRRQYEDLLQRMNTESNPVKRDEIRRLMREVEISAFESGATNHDVTVSTDDFVDATVVIRKKLIDEGLISRSWTPGLYAFMNGFDPNYGRQFRLPINHNSKPAEIPALVSGRVNTRGASRLAG